MIWWVYDTASKIKSFDSVFVAIDDVRVEEVCKKFNINYMMTSDTLPNHIARVHEVSERIKADFYVSINGDEPLLTGNCISAILPNNPVNRIYCTCAMREIKDPTEVIDCANIKIITTNDGKCLYMSRSPIPYPKGSILFSYKKYVGIECFNKSALNFFVNTPKGKTEEVEDIDHLRFLENNVSISFKKVNNISLSVDTLKDLKKVRFMMSDLIKSGGKSNE